MEFTYTEKKAMAHMLLQLAKQDGHIDNNEINVIKNALSVNEALIMESAKVQMMDAIDTVKAMNAEQKMAFALIVIEVARADGFMHPKEMELADKYFALTGISKLFEGFI